ncbi:hypothetical protein SB759_07215 [Pseudomonas sp. SIMBA_059]|uniref:hypothetical protein n=1 Tax=Pseudomonas palleroniana TaxID=191390 RepID=UPI0018E6B26A|nr:hypothetical protein [Pseudomonas palleroniana]MBI6906810.1 hypothetical protein [Pseudomonas palleroniana]
MRKVFDCFIRPDNRRSDSLIFLAAFITAGGLGYAMVVKMGVFIGGPFAVAALCFLHFVWRNPVG